MGQSCMDSFVFFLLGFGVTKLPVKGSTKDTDASWKFDDSFNKHGMADLSQKLYLHRNGDGEETAKKQMAMASRPKEFLL